MDRMTVFLCEDSVCGILTGVYDAWDSRLGHANVKLALKKGYQPELFIDCQEVGPDAEKADKVLRTLDRKMYLEDFEALYQALLSADDQKADGDEQEREQQSHGLVGEHVVKGLRTGQVGQLGQPQQLP